MLTIYNKIFNSKSMSKKSRKGKKSKNVDLEIEQLAQPQEFESQNGVLEMGYLITAILDYYSETGEPPLEEGEEWKSGTQYAPKSSLSIPGELDKEIKKAFMTQIKKFQK